MKPDWKDAPEWAQYLARDKDGDWYWHSCEPQPDGDMWITNGRYLLAMADTNWRDTLEKRPEEK